MDIETVLVYSHSIYDLAIEKVRVYTHNVYLDIEIVLVYTHNVYLDTVIEIVLFCTCTNSLHLDIETFLLYFNVNFDILYLQRIVKRFLYVPKMYIWMLS